MEENNFIFNNFDYIDYIKSAEDIILFKRLKELEPELSKPIKECYKVVMEVINIDRKLRGLLPVKFIILNDPKLN